MTARPIREACLKSYEAAMRKADQDGYLVLTSASCAGLMLTRHNGCAIDALDEARAEMALGFGWYTAPASLLADVVDEDRAAMRPAAEMAVAT